MELTQRLLAGDRRALARLISLVENDGVAARAALAEVYPHTGCAHIIGVTGAPGVGKSSLVNELAKAYRRRRATVGIVAVDPTSPFSGGAILGDRVRMNDLAGDRGIFIRSMASRGSLGGLAAATADAIKLLDAAGFQKIFVETVGAGQTEVDITRAAHTTIVVAAPGMGDDIQAIKAGIMEIADLFAVNKADREGADAAAMTIQMMLDMNGSDAGRWTHHGLLADTIHPEASRASEVWKPSIRMTVATTGEGVDALVDCLEAHRAYLEMSGRLEERRRRMAAMEIEDILRRELLKGILGCVSSSDMRSLVDQVASRQLDPYGAAEMLLSKLA